MSLCCCAQIAFDLRNIDTDAEFKITHEWLEQERFAATLRISPAPPVSVQLLQVTA